jgi:hypothetical protein
MHRERLHEHDVFIGVINNSTTDNSEQMLVIKDAIALGIPMIALMKYGTVLGKFGSNIKWNKILYWKDREERDAILNNIDNTIEEVMNKK